MRLKNPFKKKHKLLFEDNYACWECGQNHGGYLEAHHIRGRISNSPLNLAPLGHLCHSPEGRRNMTHIHESRTEGKFLVKTLKYLHKIKYKLTAKDKEFLKENSWLYKFELSHREIQKMVKEMV